MNEMDNRLRLCRLMCGRSLTFRADYFNLYGAMPQKIGAEPHIAWIARTGEAKPHRTSGGRAAE